MDKNTLHRFYNREASPQEKATVRQWLENDPQHTDEFLRERELFDAILLTAPPAGTATRHSKRPFALCRRASETLRIAAVAALLLVAGYYYHTAKIDRIASAIHTVSVPPGQRANILLPDGTNVWLNARSEIRYPSFFAGRERKIELDGEAYFEVSRDENTPFIVHTDQCDVEVLGTTFNVDAYNHSGYFSVALIEGSVRLTGRINPHAPLTLLPCHKADFVDGALNVTPIDDYDVYRWREGLLCFKDMNITELFQRLEKCYDVKIVIQNNTLSGHAFSGKLRISDGIDNALRILQKDAKYTFVRDTETDVIYIK
jgi:ferric-dicitrate binding protein FerR (iron transport regulator)